MKTFHRFRLQLLFCVCAISFTSSAQSPDGATNEGSQAEASEIITNVAASPEAAPITGKAGHQRGPMVVWGHDVELKEGEEAETVVVIGGNARVHGKVDSAVVAIFGDIDLSGKVRESTVAVLGSIRLREGADVREEAVAVLGDITAAKGTRLGHGAISVGGRVDAQEGAKVEGHIQSLDVPVPVKTWLVQCVLKLRPLAPQVGWVWLVAGSMFLLYLLVTALFPRPVQACVSELTNRPATTFFLGLLTKMLAPVVFALLALTVAGAIVVPFIVAALLLGGVVGKAALLQGLGLRFGRLARGPAFQSPLPALIIGGVVITVLYNVPVMGLLTFMVVSIWGLGGAVAAAFAGLRRELPPRPAPAPSSPVPSPISSLPASAEGAPGAAGPQVAPLISTVPDAFSFPRARFLERIAAGALDTVLLGIVCKMLHVHGFWPLVALIYFAVMWTWKGTTVGGIILGLRVTRVDGERLTFLVALVRALAAAFSVTVLFLGFLWIIWDRERQGWHDQIAGTVVVRMPRGTPLVCY